MNTKTGFRTTQENSSNIQTEQPYHCPNCGAIVSDILHYSDYVHATIPKPLDDLGEHLQYLNCRKCSKCTRVVRLGDTILPFEWPAGIDGQGERDLINALLRQIVREVGPQGDADPVASIVYRLLGGTLAPKGAIREIRALVDSAIKGAMVHQEMV